ncbi:type I restriction-modification enzyme S subunit [Cylindrospermum sp. NIES-4074]|nr:type I restriction-modification enzyme S subunit [Cylindrospermum sp. NIES-4074]
MIPKKWSFTPLAEILERVRKPVSVEHNAIYKEIGIRSHGKGIFYKEATTGEALGNKSVFWIEPYCFILNIVFAWEQAIAITTVNEQGMIASHRFPMYKPKPKFLLLDYLLYFFMTPRGKYLLELASPGGAGRNKTLGQAEFLKLEILLPPLSEQRKIVKILNTWDKAIALLEQLITAKRKLKQGLMQQLLTGKKRFNGFPDWQEKCIGDLITFSGGAQPPRSTFVFEPQDGYIRLIQIRDYKTDNFATFIPKTLAKKFCSKDDVMIGRYGPPIFQILKGIEGAYNVALIKAIPNKELDREYMFYFLKQEVLCKFVESLSQRSSGQTGIEMDQLKEYPFPLPSIREQRKIVSILSKADAEISNLEKQLVAYKQQKRGLMQQLLTGKKRVKIDEPQMQKV